MKIVCLIVVLLTVRVEGAPVTKNWDILGNIYELLNKHDDLEVKLELVPDDETVELEAATAPGYAKPDSTAAPPVPPVTAETPITVSPEVQTTQPPTESTKKPQDDFDIDALKKFIHLEETNTEKNVVEKLNSALAKQKEGIDAELKQILQIVNDIKSKMDKDETPSTASPASIASEEPTTKERVDVTTGSAPSEAPEPAASTSASIF
ncbi:unnamed protein product [Bursaphelenchus xylophilus]|uniref:(pine wood nematode) hypothetical protein n=1 Tax=Bursaphelenchus xylophilus TaxID=6326 RepID=A0A1I7RRT0_BURXY|nr:unnamed protein product [Bursaphelenchus xylophilus]CAG9123497.1 unnamed protein product [Bursaphelenchus xylophilus]